MTRFVVSVYGDSLLEVKKYIKSERPDVIELMSKETDNIAQALCKTKDDVDKLYESLVFISTHINGGKN